MERFGDMVEKQFVITESLAQKILDYITSQPTNRPVGEVLILVNEIQQIKPVQEQSPQEQSPQ